MGGAPLAAGVHRQEVPLELQELVQSPLGASLLGKGINLTARSGRRSDGKRKGVGMGRGWVLANSRRACIGRKCHGMCKSWRHYRGGPHPWARQ